MYWGHCSQTPAPAHLQRRERKLKVAGIMQHNVLAASLHHRMTAFTLLTLCNKDTELYSMSAKFSPICCWYFPGLVMTFLYFKKFCVVLETKANTLCMLSTSLTLCKQLLNVCRIFLVQIYSFEISLTYLYYISYMVNL